MDEIIEKIPSSKHQYPDNTQAPNNNDQNVWNLNIEILNLFVICNLVFGI